MYKVIITQRIPDVDWNGKQYFRTEHLEPETFENIPAAMSFIRVILEAVPLVTVEIKKEEQNDRKENC